MPKAQRSAKRILYYAARPSLANEFFRACGVLDGCIVRRVPDGAVVSQGDSAITFVARYDPAAALDALHHDFFNLVILDLREAVNGRRRLQGGRDFARGLDLLDSMDAEQDLERRYGFHRILALVSGPDAPELDDRIVRLGSRGVGRVMRDFSTCALNPGCELLPEEEVFAGQVLETARRLCEHRRVGKRALCLSGGGITGLYFELGALKCLEDCCSEGALNSCDLYFGISAGSVVCGMLANGYSLTEFMGAIAGVKEGPIPPFDMNLIDATHLDARGLMAPIRQLLSIAGNGVIQLFRGQSPFSLESLVFEYGDLIHAPFNTAGFETLLRTSFTRPGHTDDFRELDRGLYIGVTDQDLKQHVLLGDRPHDDVPISRAIAASMSLNPVFAPTAIHGRYYEDGAVTRTSNFVEAIRKGADLIVTVDPLVPYVSKSPGFARSRGVFYNADQDIRTVVYTRYETTRNWVIRRHPEVSLYTLLPANKLRRVLSVNPMDHRPFLEIWRGAYLGTLKRLRTLSYRLRGDLAFHGIVFDTTRAQEIAARLDAIESPSFADFFADGRVDLGTPARAPGRLGPKDALGPVTPPTDGRGCRR
jgi:predicted acylesterase/phospholipase RssA